MWRLIIFPRNDVSLLDRYPFARDAVPESIGAVMLWWELRRLAYNAVVGLTGVVTIALLVANALLRGDGCGIPDPPLLGLFAIVGYGVMANVCYALGAFAEVVGRVTVGRENASKLGRTAFVVGLALSVIMTISPAVLVPLLCLGHHGP
jgi:hypothetical protein